MTEAEVLDIARDAVWTTLVISLPLLLVALTVGLAVSLFQALTQIQEMTLAFVPKIIFVFLFAVVFAPFMLSTLITFTQGLFDKMIALGAG